MGALVVAYIALVVGLLPNVEWALLQRSDWSKILIGSSIIATSFGFHIVIPSLVSYLDRNVSQLRWTILIGSIIPLLVYLIWECIALGILPLTGENSITAGYAQGSNGATLLADYLQNPTTSWIARFFSLFAIITSFLGVSLSLTDFLADGLKIKRDRAGKFWLYLLTFIPPLLIALIDPRAFISALEYAGAFGVMILLGLIPALMVWRGRYQLSLSGPYRAPGGYVGLIFAIVFALIAIGIEIL